MRRSILSETNPLKQTVIAGKPRCADFLDSGVNNNALGLNTESFDDQSRAVRLPTMAMTMAPSTAPPSVPHLRNRGMPVLSEVHRPLARLRFFFRWTRTGPDATNYLSIGGGSR